jgi:hypothetical protein
MAMLSLIKHVLYSPYSPDVLLMKTHSNPKAGRKAQLQKAFICFLLEGNITDIDT